MQFMFLILEVVSLFFSVSECALQTVLKVGSATGISVFNLWNETGLHCEYNNQFYRHDFIDRMDNTCMKNLDIYFRAQTTYFRIRYSAPFNGFGLDTLLSRTPTLIEDKGVTTAAEKNYAVLINTDNYEFVLLRMDQTQIHAGIYYSDHDPLSSQIGFSSVGVPYKVKMWASSVTGYSSQYTTESGWLADEIIGPPNVYPKYGDLKGAWATLKKGTNNEYIQVSFPQNIYIEAIHIYETNWGGAVKRISGKTPSGTWYMFWTTSGISVITTSRIFSPTFPKLTFSCKELKIEIDQTASGNWAELDAVEIFGSLSDKLPPVISDEDVLYMEIIADVDDSATCVAKITPQNITACQVPDVAVQGSKNEISPNTVVLTCTILSSKPVTSVRWTKDNSNLSVVENTKYAGVTLGTHNLTIINSDIADAGAYVCYAMNAMGEGQSNAISVTVPTVVAQGVITVVNEGTNIVIACTVISEITVTATKWTKDENEISIVGNSKYGGVTLGTHNLTIYNAGLSDSGKYACNASNNIGENISSVVTVTVIHVCLCSCEYQRRLEYWASQPNHTIEEWREILAPILVELAKNLTVKKNILSNTIRRLTSSKDNRPSSTSIGVVGLTIIIIVCVAIFSADIRTFWTSRYLFHRRTQPYEA